MSKGLRAAQELEKILKHAFENPVKQCCENCRYFSESAGICRRYPPTHTPCQVGLSENHGDYKEIATSCIHPFVQKKWWCGEWDYIREIDTRNKYDHDN